MALLAAVAVLSAPLGSSAAGVEMRSSVAVENSAAPAVEGTAGVSSEDRERGGCPGRCRCEVDGVLHRVDCSDLGLREPPSNLSVFTSYL